MLRLLKGVGQENRWTRVASRDSKARWKEKSTFSLNQVSYIFRHASLRNENQNQQLDVKTFN